MFFRGTMLALALGAAFPPLICSAAVKLEAPTPGYTYFNRIGANWDAQRADITSCAAEALHVQAGAESTHVTQPFPVEQALAELITPLLNAPFRHAAFSAAIENCMVVKGWRVLRVPDQEGAALAALPSADLASRLESWIGSATPHGDVVRIWQNDAAHGSTDRYQQMPSETRNGSLSILALGNSSVDTSNGAPFSTKVAHHYHAIAPADFAGTSPDSAIIIVELRGINLHGGTVMRFNRVSPAGETANSDADTLIIVEVPLIINRREGNWRAYAVPPGTWRVASMGVLPVLNFCLGSPAFEAHAGEVVFAGAFDLSAENLGPDLSLDGVRSWLGASPASEHVRAANYTNGWTGPCGDNGIYALEIDGAPYRDGYSWGGALTSTAAQPATPVQ
jgi:hypothetical protein